MNAVRIVMACIVIAMLTTAFTVFFYQLIKEGKLKTEAELDREAVERMYETRDDFDDEYQEPPCSVDKLGLVALILLIIVFFVSLLKS